MPALFLVLLVACSDGDDGLEGLDAATTTGAPPSAPSTSAVTTTPVTTAQVAATPAPAPTASTAPPTTAPPTTAPSADPRGRRFGYTGNIGVFPMSGEFCVAVAAPITITTPPDATVDLAEVTGDPTAPSGDQPYEAEITFSAELPTIGEMSYFISAGGAFFEGTGTYEIEWTSLGTLAGTMVLRDDAATATAGGFVTDDTQQDAGIFEVSEVGTC